MQSPIFIHKLHGTVPSCSELDATQPQSKTWRCHILSYWQETTQWLPFVVEHTLNILSSFWKQFFSLVYMLDCCRFPAPDWLPLAGKMVNQIEFPRGRTNGERVCIFSHINRPPPLGCFLSVLWIFFPNLFSKTVSPRFLQSCSAVTPDSVKEPRWNCLSKQEDDLLF